MHARWVLILVGLGSVGLCGCLHQLPPSSLTQNSPPNNFDESSIISSKNGLIAADIAKLPGAICVPNANNLCDADGFLPGQYLSTGATAKVSTSNTITPNYDSVLDNSYSLASNVPFLSASGSSEEYDEVKATIVGTATIESGANAGFPGVPAIRAALTASGLNPNIGFVYWISAANIIAVSRTAYTKVMSDEQVSGTGYGANGKTYNNAGVTQESLWIGIYAHKIDLTTFAGPGHIGAAIAESIETQFKLPPPVKTQFLNVDSKGVFKAEH